MTTRLKDYLRSLTSLIILMLAGFAIENISSGKEVGSDLLDFVFPLAHVGLFASSGGASTSPYVQFVLEDAKKLLLTTPLPCSSINGVSRTGAGQTAFGNPIPICMENPPHGYDWTTPGGLLMGKICPRGTNDTGITCVQGRGVGSVPHYSGCPAGFRTDPLTCYRGPETIGRVRAAGWNGSCRWNEIKRCEGVCGHSLVSCYLNCPPGFNTLPLTCQKDTVILNRSPSCTHGQELIGLLCYPNPLPGFGHCTANLCSMSKDVRPGRGLLAESYKALGSSILDKVTRNVTARIASDLAPVEETFHSVKTTLEAFDIAKTSRSVLDNALEKLRPQIVKYDTVVKDVDNMGKTFGISVSGKIPSIPIVLSDLNPTQLPNFVNKIADFQGELNSLKPAGENLRVAADKVTRAGDALKIAGEAARDAGQGAGPNSVASSGAAYKKAGTELQKAGEEAKTAGLGSDPNSVTSTGKVYKTASERLAEQGKKISKIDQKSPDYNKNVPEFNKRVDTYNQARTRYITARNVYAEKAKAFNSLVTVYNNSRNKYIDARSRYSLKAKEFNDILHRYQTENSNLPKLIHAFEGRWNTFQNALTNLRGAVSSLQNQYVKDLINGSLNSPATHAQLDAIPNPKTLTPGPDVAPAPLTAGPEPESEQKIIPNTAGPDPAPESPYLPLIGFRRREPEETPPPLTGVPVFFCKKSESYRFNEVPYGNRCRTNCECDGNRICRSGWCSGN